MSKRSVSSTIITYMVSIIMVLSVLLPMIWIVMMGFKTPRDIISWPPLFIFKPTLENYINVFSSSAHRLPLIDVIVNSIIITIVSMIISVSLASVSAYSISRIKPRGSKALNFIVLGFRMVPPIAIVVPLYVISNNLRLFDTRMGLILPFIALNIPLATWMMEGFFQDIPKSLEEAAMIDGCTPFGAFLSVILPIAKPGIAATAVFSFILPWNNLTLPLPLTMSKAATLPVLASQVRTDEGILWGELGVIATIMMIPVIIFTIFATKYLIKGMASGAVKE